MANAAKPTVTTNGTVENEPSFLEVSTNKYKKGLLSWVLSVDHKRIGILYLYSMMAFFSVAVVFGFLIRLELIAPGKTIIDAQTYNQLFTLHGIIMIFLFIIPGLPAVFGNFFLPIMIGAKDVIFPRLNLMSWYMFVFGGLFAVISMLLPGGSADTGWMFYVPYSVRTNTNVLPALIAAFILGFSSILTGLNFITTIHRMRHPDMSWFKMPLFVWSLYATAWIQVLATPIIGVTLALVGVERVLGVGIFDPALGGDPVLYQHLFWIYSHPAVYIMILPAMGIVTEIIPVFSRRSIFGYTSISHSRVLPLRSSVRWCGRIICSPQG
jgi:cytochrome c oxidase subunit 1